MSDIVTENALIEDTFLGIEDHGMTTFILYLNYGGTCQGAGYYSLGNEKKFGSCKIIRRILEVVGVGKWEALKGKHIRAKHDYNKVYAIGHIIEDKWLDFQEFFERERRRRK